MTTTHYHALVWIDHQQAKIFHFDADGSNLEVVRSSHPHQHLHHKANTRGSGHEPPEADFLRQVARALEPAASLLIAGPAGAKTELASYIRHSQPELARRISAVQPLDHPTDGQLVALGRSFFDKEDRASTLRISP